MGRLLGGEREQHSGGAGMTAGQEQRSIYLYPRESRQPWKSWLSLHRKSVTCYSPAGSPASVSYTSTVYLCFLCWNSTTRRGEASQHKLHMHFQTKSCSHGSTAAISARYSRKVWAPFEDFIALGRCEKLLVSGRNWIWSLEWSVGPFPRRIHSIKRCRGPS